MAEAHLDYAPVSKTEFMQEEKHTDNHLLLSLRINLGNTPLHFLLAGLEGFFL